MSTSFTIKTYDLLEKWVSAFLKPNGLPLLFLVGNPGTGKSASFKTKLNQENHHYVNAAHLTSFQFYKQLYEVRDKAIILDDVDDALKRHEMARLLMSLCESDDKARTVSWFGTESLLKGRNGQKIVKIPQEFKTTSRVCIICNNWAILTSKVGALLDRGRVVFFDPDAEELHRFVGKWFEDEEIYRFIGKHLAEIDPHSIRFYVHAKKHKELGLDWKAPLLESWANDRSPGNATEKLVRRLLADEALETDKERIAEFKVNADGGSRRKWYYTKKKLALAGLI